MKKKKRKIRNAFAFIAKTKKSGIIKSKKFKRKSKKQIIKENQD